MERWVRGVKVCSRPIESQHLTNVTLAQYSSAVHCLLLECYAMPYYTDSNMSQITICSLPLFFFGGLMVEMTLDYSDDEP